MGPSARLLPDGRRLHLQHGPIDLVVEAWGERGAVRTAYARAVAAFPEILPTLAGELPRLRRPIAHETPDLHGPVARRMAAAVRPHLPCFVTPMAAVAGAVADHVLAAMEPARLDKAYVNDGGDIALHLSPGTWITLGMVADIADPHIDGTVRVEATDPVRGVATSGRGGRSFSLGVADAVTVLAATAAAADAAATLLANAVDLDLPGIDRRPACSLDPDSDLGERPVTVAVPPLRQHEVEAALAAGARAAEAMRAKGLIVAAALWLQGRSLTVGELGRLPSSSDPA